MDFLVGEEDGREDIAVIWGRGEKNDLTAG